MNLFKTIQSVFNLLICSSLLLSAPLFADEWDDHEAAYGQKFEEHWNLANSPFLGITKDGNNSKSDADNFNALNLKRTLTLNADRINILLGVFAEIDFKIIELKIQPYVEFRLQKQKTKL